MKKAISYSASSILILLLLSCSKDKEEIVIQPGEIIQHDDFQYRVTGYEVKKELGPEKESITTAGNFYLVTFKVISEAVRVDHQWSNSVAYVIDEKGNVYENKPDLQAKYNSVSSFGLKTEYTTAPQSEDSTILIFELPENVKQPYLMVRGETLMGDFFDGNKFERTKVKLF